MTEPTSGSFTTIHLDLNNQIHKDLWDRYVTESGDCGHHHTVNYIQLSMMNGLHKNLSLMTLFEGDIVGVLPLVGMRHWLFGSKVISLPFLNYGGPIADNSDIETLLCEKALAVTIANNYDQIELRSESKLSEALTENHGWQLFSHKACMLLALPDEVNALGVGNASKRAKLRSQAGLATRKAGSMGVSLEQHFGGAELLHDFYAVISENMRDLGTPVWPLSFFEQTLALTDSEITVVYWDGKPVATGWLFSHPKGRVSIPWASTLKKMNPMSVNTFLYFGILGRCIRQRKLAFDFGRSTVDTGTYRFKAQWGAQPQPCYWYCRRVDGKQIKGGHGLAGRLTPIWQHLPVGLANWLGAKIMPHLPA